MKNFKLFSMIAIMAIFAACRNDDPTVLKITSAAELSVDAGETFTFDVTVSVKNAKGDTKIVFENLPAWVSKTDGKDKVTLSGTAPTTAGEFPVTIKATNNKETKTQNFVIKVVAATPALTSFIEDFESFTTGNSNVYFSQQADNRGWTAFKPQGELEPDLRTNAGNKYVQFSAHRGYLTTAEVQEMWLVSPRLDVSNATSKTLSFETVIAYFNANTVFEAYVLDGGNPETATKTKLTGWRLAQDSDRVGGAAYSPFIPSGEIDLSSFSGVIRIGFYYKGTSGSNNSTTYQIDNFAFGGATVTTLTCSPNSLTFTKEGGEKTFTVTSSTTWSAVSSDPANFAVSVNGNDVTVTATANTGTEPRPATITVTTTDNSATKTVAVMQAGNVAVGTNLLVNGSFEDFTGLVPASWAQSNSPDNQPYDKITTGAQDGSIAVKLLGNNDGRCDIKQAVSGIVGGETYVVSFWYKDNTKTAGSSGIRIWSSFTKNGSNMSASGASWASALQPNATFAEVTEWTKYEVEVEAPVDADGFNFEIRATKNNSGIIDNCSISLKAN